MIHEHDRFRPDNTEGYNLHQLAELNRRYARRAIVRTDLSDAGAKAELDSIAERVQAEYDSEECHVSETVSQQIARVTSFEDCIIIGCRLPNGHEGHHEIAPTSTVGLPALPEDEDDASQGSPEDWRRYCHAEGGYHE